MSDSIHKPRIAFQGEPGAFSEAAAIELLGSDIELVPRRTFTALFASLDDGFADFVLAPVENTIAGVVHPSVDLLRSSALQIVNEVTIPVEQHLIACPGTTLEDVETVQSHPVALAQCARFFAQHPKLKQLEADDTAGSVAEIVKRGERRLAAIAGRRAAQLYGGTIIRESIQDVAENYTRFVLLSASVEKEQGGNLT
jgi:prephenate dehydratase